MCTCSQQSDNPAAARPHAGILERAVHLERILQLNPMLLQNTANFCQTVLCNPRITAYARSHFITWATQVGSPSASHLTDLLRVSSYPYLAVLTSAPSYAAAAAASSSTVHRRPQPIRLLASVDGAASAGTVMDALEGAVAAVSASSRSAARRANTAAEARSVEARSVRQAQDAALAASMVEDRRRAQAAEEERQRVEAARQAEEDSRRAEACVPLLWSAP